MLGVRLNGPKAEGKRIVLNWNFTDTRESFVLNLENCALTYTAGAQAAEADASFTLARGVLDIRSSPGTPTSSCLSRSSEREAASGTLASD